MNKVPLLLLSALSVSLLPAADFSVYRGFHFGAPVAAVAKQALTDGSEIRTIHTRPALIQQLTWRPGYQYSSTPTRPDPVQEAIMRFYNGELFQIVSTYDYHLIEGLTAADLVSGISATYGVAATPDVMLAFHSNYAETARVIARWEDENYSYSLVRTGDQSSYALVLSSKRLAALAEVAITEALRLDVVEAPQRALELLKKQESDGRSVLNKARATNLPNFRP